MPSSISRRCARSTPAISSCRSGVPPGVPVYVDYAQGGSFIEWSRTLERALALDFDTIVPGHGPIATRADLMAFNADQVAMHTRLAGLVTAGTSRAEIVRVLEADYGWRSTGCPPSPPTPGCLQYQQVDALIAELGAGAGRGDTGTSR